MSFLTTDRDLLIVSSMGMVGDPALDTSEKRTVTARDPEAFVRAIGFDGDYVIGENTVAFRKGWLPDAYIEHGYWVAASMR